MEPALDEWVDDNFCAKFSTYWPQNFNGVLAMYFISNHQS